VQTLLNLLAAIALLVWGTHMVRNGVLRMLGASLRQILHRSRRRRSTAFLAGLGVTGLLQSSTATALLVSSFVGKGLITTGAALAVMLGGLSDPRIRRRAVEVARDGRAASAILARPAARHLSGPTCPTAR
jgi:hypothetical protein